MTRRALLVGGSGQLGSDLLRQAGKRWTITAPSHAELDIMDKAALSAMVEQLAPELVVNCSAFHVVDACEDRFEEALRVNAIGVSSLARAACKVGARFLTLSTDYVFDGNKRLPYQETDPVNPLQCYGISKAAGEFAALSAHPEGAIVVRSCGLYGRASSRQKGGNFVLSRLNDARSGREISVGCDLVCTPTSTVDLAAAILDLLDAAPPAGVYHLTNSGACDWAEFAAEIFRLAGTGARVIPVDRQGRYTPARRPAYTVLDCAKANVFQVHLRPWQEALANFIATVTG